jgi:hypothetical protein
MFQNNGNQHKKSVAFLPINNELSKNETKKTIPFLITTKKKKILNQRINLTEEVKHLYSGNYETLMK